MRNAGAPAQFPATPLFQCSAACGQPQGEQPQSDDWEDVEPSDTWPGEEAPPDSPEHGGYDPTAMEDGALPGKEDFPEGGDNGRDTW